MPDTIRVLHVDDEPDFLDLASTFLERQNENITVITEESAEEALTTVSEEDIDCIVSDYQMPEMNGLELLREVREQRSGIPFILFTGKGSEEIASEAISAGVTDYIQKESGTYQYEVLANRIENAVSQHKAEVALERSEERYRQLVEMSPVPVVLYNDEGNLVYVNQATVDFVGAESEEELIGEPAIEFIHPEDRNKINHRIRRVLEEREPVPPEEIRIVGLDGEIKYVVIAGAPVTHQDGVSGQAVLEDITGRKEQERRLETLIGNLPGIVYRCKNEPEWHMEFVGGECEELTGYTASKIENNEVHWGEDIIHPEDQERVWGIVQDSLERDESFEITYRIVTKEGNEKWVWERGQGVYPSKSEQVLEGFISDITVRKRREEALEALHDVAVEIEACDTEEEVYELAVEAAEEVLDFDMCVFDTVEGDKLVTKAVSSGVLEEGYYETTPLDSEDNLGVRTHKNHESYLVDDLYDEDVEPADEAYRSVISVPVGDIGIFQAVSKQVDHFDEDDIELAELLVSHVAEGVERLRTQEELKQERDLISALFENIPEPAVHYVMRDGEPYVQRVNPAFEDVFGYERDKVIGESLDDFIVPPEKEEEADSLNERVVEGERIDTEVRRRTSEGIRDFRLLDAPIRAGTDEFEGYVIYADITERKERERKLREERDRFNALFESVPEPVAHVRFRDQGEHIVQNVNSTFEKVFGYDADTLVGDSLNNYIVPEGHEDEANRIDKQMEVLEETEMEIRRKTADGELRDFLFRAIPFKKKGEEIIESVGIYVDITKQKDREGELERQKEALEEFASVVSHDLRNPLNVVEGYVEMALETGETEHLEKALDGLGRTNAIIEDVLTLARQGRTVGELEEIDLNSVVKSCWTNVDTRNAELRIVDDLGVINADKGRLSQLLENLFSNSVEHGGENPTIRVGRLEDGFYVEDDGPGIPESERDKIFDHGYSTSEEGTGFGLSIVESIAEAHGWGAELTESEEGGARFEITGIS